MLFVLSTFFCTNTTVLGSLLQYNILYYLCTMYVLHIYYVATYYDICN